MIDHRHSPGLTDAETQAAGLPAGAGRGLYEVPTYTCSHCQGVVIMHPARGKDRGYCRRCDHYICDTCTTALHVTGICKPFRETIYEHQVKIDKGIGGSNG